MGYSLKRKFDGAQFATRCAQPRLAPRRLPRIQTRTSPAVAPRSTARTLVVRGRETDPAEHVKLLSDARTDLREVHFTDARLSADFFSRLASQTALRALTLRNLKAADSDVSLDFLYSLINLEALVLDDVWLAEEDLLPVLSLKKLRKLTLGIQDLRRLPKNFWDKCPAKVSLVLYGDQPYEIGQFLMGVTNLAELSFKEFGAMEFPSWIRFVENLETVTFADGCVYYESPEPETLFPPSLWRFSSTNCSIDGAIRQLILKNGGGLSDLELDLESVSGSLNLDHCENVRVLKLHAKEFDGEALEQVSKLQHLRELHFSGCLGLSSSHISCLRPLRELERIGISNCFVSPAACNALGLLGNLQDLTFECCFGLRMSTLTSLTNLSSIKLSKCIELESELNELVDDLSTQSLESFSIHF